MSIIISMRIVEATPATVSFKRQSLGERVNQQTILIDARLKSSSRFVRPEGIGRRPAKPVPPKLADMSIELGL